MELAQNVTVEPAGAGEIADLYGRAEELIRRYEDGTQVPLEEALAWTYRKIEKKIHEYRVIRYCGEKAGYYRFFRNGEGMELDDLYVLEPFRSRGIGSFVIRQCCQSTMLPVYLYVFRENTRAVALYTRLGFRICRQIDQNRYLMRRDGHERGKDESYG